MAKHAGLPAPAVLMDVVTAAGLDPNDVTTAAIKYDGDVGTCLAVEIILNDDMLAVLKREADL